MRTNSDRVVSVGPKTTVMLSFLWLLLNAAILPVAGLTADNLAANPGFEEWPDQLQSTTVQEAVGYSVGVEGRDGGPNGRAYRSGDGAVDTERRSGKYAQFMQTTTWGRGAIASGVPVKVGHRYRVSVWVKALAGKFQLGVCFAHEPWTYLGDWQYLDANGKWTQVVKEVVIPEGASRISAVMFLQSGSAYLDDFEIVDLGVATTEDEGEDRTPLLKGNPAPGIARKRVAIFDEPNFPSESPRPVAWYEAALKRASLVTHRLSLKQLTDARQFNRDKFDTLLLPTGGNFPSQAEAQIEAFLAKGGTVLIDEHFGYRTTAMPPQLSAELDARRIAYESGKDGYGYFDYWAKHFWASYANMFRFDETDREWRPTLSDFQSYEAPVPAQFALSFNLRLWPNYGEAVYARPFSEPVRQNPTLANVMAGFPEIIPADEKPSRELGAIRIFKAGERNIGGLEFKPADEYACDLLLPLYQFPEVSNYAYPSFPDAGKNEKDRDADFYIMRYHNYLMEGGTVVHFGLAGAKLLRSEKGEEVLLASLRLAESELPGECPPDYVKTANAARERFSQYSAKSIRYRESAGRLARLAKYSGQAEDIERWKKSFQDEQQQFVQFAEASLQLNDLLSKRVDGYAYGHRARQRFVRQLEESIRRLDERLAEADKLLVGLVRSPQRIAAKNPFSYLYFGQDHSEFRGPWNMNLFRQQIERMGLPFEGYGLTSYRQEYTFNPHPFKRKFDSGRLDPATGIVTPTTFEWMETDEDIERWKESFRWQLERASKDPTINSVFGMDERDFEWSLWGPRMRKRFVKYIEGKYRNVSTLNGQWNTAFASFDDVELPTRQPKTQSEHALWEDWTRFREIYRYEWEMKPSVDTIRKYAPNLKYFTWSTYDQHAAHPANGINFYEYGKLVAPVNGFEHSNEERKEWLAFDIVSAFSRHATAEWGAFYFPPASHQEKIDLLKETLWKGAANGQVGWSSFLFSYPGRTASNYVDMMNLPLPLGNQLQEVIKDLRAVEHIILDGERDPAPVRIVYSPTTRRHTSWPGVQRDISFDAAGGLYSYFQNSHLHARAIDEQEIWEGQVPAECKLLILSEVQYQNQRMHQAVLRYVQNGGNVLVTTGSGRFDEYGRRSDSWLALAGVVPVAVKEKIIPVGEGMRYFSAAHSDDMVGLRPVFEGDAKIVTRYVDQTPAITETCVGKGKVFVIGVNLGLDCNVQWKGNPAVVDALLKPVLDSANVERQFQVSDSTIMVRPWTYNNRRFVFLSSPARDGLTDFDFAVRGAWKVKDYLLGAEVEVRKDREYSRISGLMSSPGAVVLELVPDPAGMGQASAASPLPKATNVQVHEVAAEQSAYHPIDRSTPFEGRIWARDGVIKLGDYSFEMEIVTGGGWGGKPFLVARHGRETLRQPCEKGKNTLFHFTDSVVTVEIRDVTSVYPANIDCRITVADAPAVESSCSVREELFHGMESVVLTNGLVRLRILPRLGGRVVEFISLPDGTNHAALNTEVASKGITGSSGGIGGMKENPGGYPGPFMSAPFDSAIVENTPERVVVRLAMQQASDWSYGYAKPTSGRNRLVKEFVLSRGQSLVEVRLHNFNEAEKPAPTGLRIHAEWAVGGDGGPGDRWILTRDGGAITLPYPFSGTFEAEGDWTAIADTSKRMALIQQYDPKATESVYTVGVGQGNYNLELWAQPQVVDAGKSFDFNHTLSLVRGLSSVLTFDNNVAINIVPLESKSAAGEGTLRFDVEVGSPQKLSGDLKVTLLRGGKPVTTFSSRPVTSAAGRVATFSFEQSEAGAASRNGGYTIRATFLDKTGADDTGKATEALFQFAGGAVAHDRLGKLKKYEAEIQKLALRYRQSKPEYRSIEQGQTLRATIVRATILLDELREHLTVNDLAGADSIVRDIEGLLNLFAE